MDPNANLAEQLILANRILNGEEDPCDSERLAELVLAMNEWLSKQGFKPERWK
jgi:hypothetical protein